MDDPWGSPWADETPPLKLESKGPEEVQKDISVVEKNTAREDKRKSVWDDDNDGFGDWTGAGSFQENQAHATTNISGEWEFGRPEENRLDNVQPASDAAPAWFSEPVPDAIAGEKRQSVLHDTPGFLDPWAGAVEDTQDVITDEKLVEEVLDAPAKDTTSTLNTETDIAELLDAVATVPHQELEDLPIESKIFKKLNDDATNSKDTTNQNTEEHENPTDEPLSTDAETEKGDKGETPSSRQSLSLSDNSNHQQDVVESSRTSFEEELKRPTFQEQDSSDSSKVKHLVQHFDKLAVKPPDAEVRERSQERSQERKSSGIDGSGTELAEAEVPQEDDDDFGDFEEGVSYVSANGSSHENEGPDEASIVAIEAEETQSLHQPSRPQSLIVEHREFHGPVKFDTDITLVDKIFKPEESDSSDVEYPSSDVENVIRDSFTTVEQRKTWYRISRYGTMRKYNTGDDDNYVRIDWAHSKVREDTLRVVERWMEEDRIAGGVMFGGKDKLGAMFGWGKEDVQPAAEAPDRHRRRKSSQTSNSSVGQQQAIHTTTSSVLGHSRKRSSLDKALPTSKAFHGSPIVASPHFTWSTSQPTSANTEPPPFQFPAPKAPILSQPSLASLPRETSSPQKPKEPSSIRAIPASAVAVEGLAKVQPLAQLNVQSSAAGDDDEDEWGEMVASPSIETAPTFPVPATASSTFKPGHKPSQSIMDILNFSNMSQLPPSKPHHKPSLSSGFSTPIAPWLANGPSSSSNPTPNAPSATQSGGTDAWASADFSFFDTPSSAPALAVSPQSSSSGPHLPAKFRNVQNTNTANTPLFVPFPPRKPIPPKPFQTASQSSPQSPLTPMAKMGWKSREEIEQDKIVKQIIDGLPDLRYMLIK
jgi:hypothetical protein